MRNGAIGFGAVFLLVTSWMFVQVPESPPKQARRDVRAVRPEDRQRIAKELEASFREQDLDVTALAVGNHEDMVLFTSEIFAKLDGRVAFMKLLRKHWETNLCLVGFKKVSLTEPGLFSKRHDYDLHCPSTVEERKAGSRARHEFAAGIQRSLKRDGGQTQVRASGPYGESLSYASQFFKTKQDRLTFFGMVRERVGGQLCGLGFTEVRLYHGDFSAQPSRYPLNCTGNN